MTLSSWSQERGVWSSMKECRCKNTGGINDLRPLESSAHCLFYLLTSEKQCSFSSLFLF